MEWDGQDASAIPLARPQSHSIYSIDTQGGNSDLAAWKFLSPDAARKAPARAARELRP